MDIGSFVLAWAPIPLILTMAGYFMVAVGATEFRLSARVVYWILLGFVLLAFLDLFLLFMGDKFQFSYVASYSSSDLSNKWPHFFKISALWAGQQGTFLLWLVYGLLLGIWVKARAKENEGWVMFFYMLGQVFLVILTLVSNPFEKLDFVPADGQGLNPLLQNYWMQIHPPIVFIGFAATCIPFAFAMAALATNRYDNWVKQTMPWAVFSVITLGLGIFLGGYWAYETLGWGGYWSWDPVENASVIPWFTGVALVHGMVIERTSGSWRRTNLFLAITTFLLIVYGTFLTRSGVLADFSVHSFTDLGYNTILLVSMIVLAVVAYALWAYRATRIKGAPAGTEILSQEFTTFLSVALLLPFTLLVLLWTSFPLITTLFSKLPVLSALAPGPAAIDTSYYNMAGLIFAIIFAAILGFNSLLFWKKTDAQTFVSKLIAPLIVGFLGAALFIVLGFSKIVETWSGPDASAASFKAVLMIVLYFLFFFAALFALFSNLLYLIRRWNTGLLTAGGYFSHVGFSILLIGIISSSGFGSKSKLTIGQGESNSALGYTIKFAGTERITSKEERANFEVTKGQRAFAAYSVSKEMQRGNETQYVRTPFIKKRLFSDLYLSLENLTGGFQVGMQPLNMKIGDTTSADGNTIIFIGYDSEEGARQLGKILPRTFEIAKGKTYTLKDLKVTFEKFDMGQHQGGMTSKIGAVLSVEYRGKVDTVTPTYEPLPSGEHTSPPVAMPGGGTIALTAIKADVGIVQLTIAPEEQIQNVKVGTILKVISGADTVTVTPALDPTRTHGHEGFAFLPNGSQLYLVEINPEQRSASFILVPSKKPVLATVEFSVKPMINLVWLGFLTVVFGTTIAVIRRMREKRSEK